MIVVTKKTILDELKEICDIDKKTFMLIWDKMTEVIGKHLVRGDKVYAVLNGHCKLLTYSSRRLSVNYSETKKLWINDKDAFINKTKVMSPIGSRIDCLDWVKSKRPWPLKRLYNIYSNASIKELIKKHKTKISWHS